MCGGKKILGGKGKERCLWKTETVGETNNNICSANVNKISDDKKDWGVAIADVCFR